MVNCFETIRQHGVLPVIVMDRVEHAIPLAEALSLGDLPVMEITLRSSAGLSCIEAVARFDRWMVGAGTVLNRDDARRAVNCGAQFIVSPGLDEGTVAYCLDRNIPVIPGVCTATEVQQAYNMGLRVMKFFPAEAFGGVATIKALSAPFSHVNFIPTGGIALENLDAYLELSSVMAVGGSWMVPRAMLEAGDFAHITSLAQFARQRVKMVRHE